MPKSIEAVIFRGTVMPWSLLIMLATWHWSSHGLLLTSDGDVLEAIPGGIVERPHRRPWYGWEVRVPLDFLPLAARWEMYGRAKLRQSVSHGYDWRYFLAYLLNRPRYQVGGRDVCWEFVEHVLRPWVPAGEIPARTVGRHVWRAIVRAATESPVMVWP